MLLSLGEGNPRACTQVSKCITGIGYWVWLAVQVREAGHSLKALVIGPGQGSGVSGLCNI